MKILLLTTLCIMMSGCSIYSSVSDRVSNILPPDVSPAYKSGYSWSDLKSLPEPVGSIAVSVYSFRDQTGQYKPLANTSTFSTAVTQGATSILMQALTETPWFVPLEREGIQNILTERKILTRSLEKQGTGQSLPSLTSSNIILEGGIISYDSNTKTGGLGIEYFGIGGSEYYQEDIISVYLRAVDIRSGQVLLSVSASKHLLSIEERAGFYRFLSYKRLGEMEAGFSNNEPAHLCVKQAIEIALTELIQKGIDQSLWQAKQVT